MATRSLQVASACWAQSSIAACVGCLCVHVQGNTSWYTCCASIVRARSARAAQHVHAAYARPARRAHNPFIVSLSFAQCACSALSTSSRDLSRGASGSSEVRAPRACTHARTREGSGEEGQGDMGRQAPERTPYHQGAKQGNIHSCFCECTRVLNCRPLANSCTPSHST
jgi:hypothetical protein